MKEGSSCGRHFIRNIVLGLASVACVVATSPARADEYSRRSDDDGGSRRDHDKSRTHIAVDFDYSTALDAPATKSGGGGALRFGQEFDLLLISLTPELGGSYHGFGGSDDAKLYTGFLGGRLAVGKIVEPSIFGHLGLGRLEGNEKRTAPVMDAGLAVDFTLLPLIDLGVHGAYNVMLPRDDGSSLKYLTLGAHAALVL